VFLQKHDKAAAAAIQNQTKLKRMKTKQFKMNWLITMLGIAVVAGSLVAGTTYRSLERETQANEALTATLDRLQHDLEISSTLKTIHDGNVDGAAQRLDLLLCGNILRTNAELESADVETRVHVQDAFRRKALLRPKTANGAAAAPTQECTDDRATAQRILELALAHNPGTQTR
jgi:hypothetical protein